MNCEEFEARGLDPGRDKTLSPVELASAREHVSFCTRCAALQDSWLAASEELRAYGQEHQAARAPARVEMRLRQEFRTQHRTHRIRRASLVAGWALAAALVIAAAASWVNWHGNRQHHIAKNEVPATGVLEKTVAGPTPAAREESNSEPQRAIPSIAKDSAHHSPRSAKVPSRIEDPGTFTLLPGSSAGELDDATVLRVRMQRGALEALGLPENEERAGEWVMVDFLVSEDGLPQAVRLRQ